MNLRTTLAVSAYDGAKQLKPDNAATQDNGAGAAARSFTETLRESETTAVKAMTGEADPQALVQALAETQLAVETAVTVRDRVVEAYQEILRMPV
jgi:flagellar hook-basal body complex protein FliE